MILLDSNIIIYLRDPRVSQKIVDQLQGSRLHTCNIVVAEVLGYPELDKADTGFFEELFASMQNHLFDAVITKKVIELRRATKIELPDAILAATAIENELVLWTHNLKDFAKVPNLRLLDPLS